MFSMFDKYQNLTVTISEKKDGSMKLLPESSANFGRNMENRKKFFNIMGINAENAVSAEIAHGNQVEIVGMEDGGKVIISADGLLTNRKDVFLSVTVADCLPVFLFEPEKKVIGILHAGWRGLEKKIISVAIEKMAEEFGCMPGNILAGIGPAICQKHFEVRDEVAVKFKDYPEAILNESGKIFLDLKKVAERQLISAGVKTENIERNQECVFELPGKYFSFRREKQINCLAASRDKQKEIEAMMAVIGIK